MTLLIKTEIASLSSAISSAGTVVFAMTDAVMISIVTSLSAVIMAGISAYFAYKAKGMAELTKITAEDTHKAVNSRLTEFMEMSKKTFIAEGVAQEKLAEDVRKAAAIVAKAEGVAQEKLAEDVRKAAAIVAKAEGVAQEKQAAHPTGVVSQEQLVDALKKLPPTL